MTQRPDGPADILERLRVASRNNIAREVCEHAILEIERLRVELTAITCSWKIAEAEIERLQAIVETITRGAKWCGWQAGTVTANVKLWNIPNCDGRHGTLLEAAEKSRTR